MAAPKILRDLSEKVAPRNAALVVVDIQNDFCDERGFFGTAGYDIRLIQAAAHQTAEMIDRAREHDVPIVYTRSVYDDHYLNNPMRERTVRRGLPPRCESGAWGTDFYLVEPRDDEPVVSKHRYSAFQYTDFDAVLQAWGVQTLIMTGVTTNVCVESTAREGYFRGYYIVAVADCTGTTSEDRSDLTSADLQKWTLTNIDLTFGIVANSMDILRAWKESI